ncbi:polar amino acid transport system substrate-binding protein [Pseudomonas duriflava]|uniref:Polar amino acid transport system substrate-binding protein n=1 Tax=Pseudomonas duriflava TaxID=459528 RepID=A0A562QDH3_9PSED|nr:transporter substrate-binding domain-containing protein [Pseudomonas duriflava]TWI54801.1 polar amino acid transport system substrate-binding protein [Pseudomonas duriflava]
MRLYITAAAFLFLVTPWLQAETIHVVTEQTPYTGVRDGKVVGAATKVVELTLNRAELKDYRINLYPWARAYDMAMHQPNVLIFLIARTPEREALFKWTGEVTNVQYHLYKLKSRTDIQPKDVQDARRYNIGVLRNDVRHQYLTSQGFTRLVVSATSRDNFHKLLNNQIQLVPMTDGDAAAECEQSRFDCSQLEKLLTLDRMNAPLYIAYSLQTPDETVERTRKAFLQLKAEGVVDKILGTH